MKKNIFKITMIGLVTGFVNGIFGAGGGIIVVPAMERLLKVEEHQSHATAIGVILPLSIISAVIYIGNGVVDWNKLLLVAVGGSVGGYIGARLLNKIPALWLHRIFGLFMIIAAIRMILS